MTSYLRKQVLLSKQKELTKKGKRNRSNASIALTSDELNTFYEKGLLGTRNPDALLNTLLKQHYLVWAQRLPRTWTWAGAI